MVPHDFQSAQLVSNPSAANQAACATWTQDTRVHAVVLPGLVTDNLLHCLDKARTPLIQSGAEIFRQYASTYKRYLRYFHISAMEGDRFDRLAIQRLLARGYFTPWDRLTGRPGGTAPVRVGVVIRNDDDYDSQLASLKRSFAAAGITPFSYDRCPATINTSSCMQNLELRYQANNVTHVYGQFDTIFMNTANSQGYRPRYFVPIELNLFAQNAPGNQLVGAMAESYLPTSDVPDEKDPGGPTDATTRCLALMEKGGQIPRTRLARASMASICDSFWFIEAAIKRHGSLTDDALEQGLQQLGTSVQSALTWATRLGPDQHAGTSGLRDLAYEEACRCFSYVSRTTHTG